MLLGDGIATNDFAGWTGVVPAGFHKPTDEGSNPSPATMSQKTCSRNNCSRKAKHEITNRYRICDTCYQQDLQEAAGIEIPMELRGTSIY